MDVIAVVLMSIGLILAPVIGFFYPAWLRMKGEEVSEKKLYGIRAAGIGALLLMYVLTQAIR
ncbi:hypothetical protein [Alkalihalobacillus sp. CinArs1]|uniref:hypothetical protein n=1 Tax=Alkalihalobacillus sp. CinArs1 TaxID=2995314 RepID=UPI0022DDABE4|nr:hypothetical protein [Alkalihalobacillus sp. CinArs1]